MDNLLWWRDGVIYQIYTRSFADSNDDGLGDLPGIISHLDYLVELGVDALWLSPVYPSPDKDFGYDVSDYCDIDPRFGTLKDFDVLLQEAHRRGLRIIMDLVLNHTSDQHPWFRESRSSRDNSKRDWYIWRDKPNNWQSVLTGSAWELDPITGQYFLHSFVKEQPDVNWRNPELRRAMLDVFRFWLERGVDGFRLDVFNLYFKDELFRDNPPQFGLRGYDRQQHIYDCDRPEMIPLLNEIRRLLDSYPERYSVGETHLSSPEKAFSYCGPDRLHAAFSFFINPTVLFGPFSLKQLRQEIERREQTAADRVWPTVVLSNHDMPRIASRYGKGEEDESLKVMLTQLFTLRGTPFLYFGEEVGMRDISLRRNEILDPAGKLYWPFYKGRDGSRAPMQWDDSPLAGFSSTQPWLPVHPDYPQRNLSAQRLDPDSLFNFTKKLIALRREYPALRQGSFRFVSSPSNKGLAYLRECDGQSILVALNFTARRITLPTLEDAGLAGRNWSLLFSSVDRSSDEVEVTRLSLAPYEVCILVSENH